MTSLTSLLEWQELEKHAQALRSLHIRDLLQSNPARINTFKLNYCNIELDYSNQLITHDSLEKLFELANVRSLPQKVNDLFHGKAVNQSENKQALHTSLRAINSSQIFYTKEIRSKVSHALDLMKSIAEKIRANEWLGKTGKVIKDIVNIGIGGSDLGPKMSIDALEHFCTKKLNFHFISDIDKDSFQDVVNHLNPETTLFIVSSKSFTTQETLTNFKKAYEWIGAKDSMTSHFIAVTANESHAKQHGFRHILPIFDWVGGRYSLCSAINLITMIGIGYIQFLRLLRGANAMDEHFYYTPFAHNMPVLLGLLGIWNINFFKAYSHSILCYSKRLKYFVPYIQQLDMESNGKRIDNQEQLVDYATGPIVWGGLGNQAQHAYYQLLCQGTHNTPCDFIMLKNNEEINAFAKNKIRALSIGRDVKNAMHLQIPGNMPLNKITLDELTPFTLGALISLYEHKIYTQSVIWDINPFDQPGVESAKAMALEHESASPIPINDSL